MEIQDFVQLVISGGGAAIGAYYALRWLFDRTDASPRDKRIIAFALTALFASTAAVLGMWLTSSWPITTQDWVRTLFRDASTAILVNQLWHAGWDLPRTT